MPDNITHQTGTTSLYFIRAGNRGPIKLGLAADVLGRASALQTGNHRPLRILATIPHADEMLEAKLHDQFHGCRVCGEWFRPTPELWSFIRNNAVKWSGRQLTLRLGRQRPTVALVRKTITLSPALASKADDVAADRGIPLSTLIENLITPYVSANWTPSMIYCR